MVIYIMWTFVKHWGVKVWSYTLTIPYTLLPMSDSKLLIELSWTEIFSSSVYSIYKNRGIEEEPDIAAVVKSCKDIDVDCEERINVEDTSCPSVD